MIIVRWFIIGMFFGVFSSWQLGEEQIGMIVIAFFFLLFEIIMLINKFTNRDK